MGDTSETKLSVAMEETAEAPANRVYVRARSFARSPSNLPIIKEAVLKGAEKAAKGLTEICGSEVVDLAVVYCAGGKHHHHTVRAAARDGLKFTATLHIDKDGNVIDHKGKKTKRPFKNGGKEEEGSCDFDRGLFEVI